MFKSALLATVAISASAMELVEAEDDILMDDAPMDDAAMDDAVMDDAAMDDADVDDVLFGLHTALPSLK